MSASLSYTSAPVGLDLSWIVTSRLGGGVAARSMTLQLGACRISPRGPSGPVANQQLEFTQTEDTAMEDHRLCRRPAIHPDQPEAGEVSHPGLLAAVDEHLGVTGEQRRRFEAQLALPPGLSCAVLGLGESHARACSVVLRSIAVA
jgi:hypothetical protein